MKKVFGIFFLLFVVLAIGVSAAQDPTTGPIVDPLKIDAILIFIGGGIVTTITEILKKVTKATGTGAVILTGIVAVAATAVYFLFLDPMIPAFNLITFILYAVVIFGEATGFFHFYQKRA